VGLLSFPAFSVFSKADASTFGSEKIEDYYGATRRIKSEH